MSSKNRTVRHGRFESDGKVSEIIDMYGDMKVSGHTSRNTESGDKIDPKSSRGRNEPYVSTWSASTASTASDGDITSRLKSKRAEVSIQSKGQAQEFEDKFFRPSSFRDKIDRAIQSSGDNTPTRNTKRQNTLRDLEGKGEKPLPLTPGSRRRVETAARALKDAQEERRQGRGDDGKQVKTDKIPREPAPVRKRQIQRVQSPREGNDG